MITRDNATSRASGMTGYLVGVSITTETAAPDAGLPATSRISGPAPGWSLAAALLGFFVVTLDAVIVNVALPDIHRELAGGMSGLQWVVNGYTLMFAALISSSGRPGGGVRSLGGREARDPDAPVLAAFELPTDTFLLGCCHPQHEVGVLAQLRTAGVHPFDE